MSAPRQVSSRRYQRGLTLVEGLIVLAIVAILLGIFSSSLLRSLRNAELRDATTQLAVDLRRSRSLAQRNSQDMVISWSPDAGGKSNTYTINGSARTLPGGVTFQCTDGCSGTGNNNVTYLAPYGELLTNVAPAGKVLTVSSPTNGIAALQVRVVGLTGKVTIVKP